MHGSVIIISDVLFELFLFAFISIYYVCITVKHKPTIFTCDTKSHGDFEHL